MNTNDHNGWMSMSQAVAHTGRSLATLKRAVKAGKIQKRLIPVHGRKPEPHLLVEDLDRFLAVHIPTPVIGSLPVPMTRSVEPIVEPVLAKLAELFPPRAEIGLQDKLCWTMKEARRMTGLTGPALRELIARKPGLVIRQGRRMWIKAAGLRKVLG